MKAGIAIDKLSLKWRLDLSDKIKFDYVQAVVVNITVKMHHMNINKTDGKEVRWKIQNDTTCSFEEILNPTAHKTVAVQPLTSHLKYNPIKTIKTFEAKLEKQGRTQQQRSSMDPYT